MPPDSADPQILQKLKMTNTSMCKDFLAKVCKEMLLVGETLALESDFGAGIRLLLLLLVTLV